MGSDSPSEILDIIKKIQKSGIGDEKRISFLEKVVRMGKNLKPEDEEYLIRLLYQLENEKSDTQNELPKIEIDEFKKILNAYKRHYAEKAKEALNDSKFKLAGSKICERCSAKLGFKKYIPEKNWSLSGYLCKDCYDYIRLRVTNYFVTVKKYDGIILQQNKGILSIQNFDNTNRIVFGVKEKPVFLSIPVGSIQKYEIIEFEEKSKTKRILTLGLRKTITNPHFLIRYRSESDKEFVINSKDLAKILTSVGNLYLEHQKKQKSKETNFENYT